jgi:HAD superfamily hydrolase (TIGR01509 family)
MFSAVIFDWDGTLVDTRQAILLSFRRALGKVKVVVPDALIERRIGIGAEQTFREILQSRAVDFDDALIGSLVQEKIQAEIDLGDTITLLPGVHILLESLQGRIPLALASMNNRAVIGHLLDKLDLRRFFDAALTVEDISLFKPNPEIFLKCAALLGISPKRCLVVEDSIFGVKAAKTAGMRCLAVSTGAYGKTELAELNPDMLFSSLSDTDKVLRFMLQ